MKKLLLIDGNAIMHRAYHALPLLTASDGTVINAVYGFNSLQKRFEGLFKAVEEKRKKSS